MNGVATMDVRDSEGAAIIDIRGDLTADSEAALSEAYRRASETANAVILNFGGLEYMNSSGIGLLVTLLIRANRQHKRLLVYGLSQHYRHIFQITRLDDALPIFETEAEAVGSLTS